MRTAFTLAVLIALSHGVVAAQQQQSERTGFVVHQLFVCAPANQERLDQFTDDVIAPIVEQLKAEGLVRSWMVLAHAWGDEWNNVWVTVTDSHEAFLRAWSELVRRLNAAAPNWPTEIAPLCSLHKDNMYAVRNAR